MSSLDTSLFLAEVASKTCAEQAFELIEHFRGKSLYVAHGKGAVRLKASTLATFVGDEAALHLSACFPDRVFEFPEKTPLHAYIAALLGAGEKTFVQIAYMLHCTRSHVDGVRKSLLKECETLPVVLEVRKRLGGWPGGWVVPDSFYAP